MLRKSALTTIILMLALAIGVTGATGAGAAGTLQGAPATAHAQSSKQGTTEQGNPLAPINSGFTYQGRLTNGGAAANGLFDFTFTLWDALSGGTQVGGLVGTSNLAVNNGLFTVNLDFGPGAFQGQIRWLEIRVRQAGGGSFTTLSPRQQFTAAPYAMSLMPGAVITGTTGGSPLAYFGNASGLGLRVEGTSSTSPGLYAQNNDPLGIGIEGYGAGGPGVYGLSSIGSGVIGEANNSSSARGVWGKSTSGTGVHGTSTSGAGGFFTSTSYIAVRGDSNSNTNAAIYGVNYGTGTAIMGQQSNGGTALYGLATTGYGVYGSSTSNSGVHGSSTSGNGVLGWSSTGYGVSGSSTNNYGVYGNSSSSTGVSGSSSTGYGVSGSSSTGYGVSGYSSGGFGVAGQSGSSTGVFGTSTNYRGVHGTSANGIGVYGATTGSSGAGVYAESTAINGNGVWAEANNGAAAWAIYGVSTQGYAGFFTGNVQVAGTLAKSAGSFKIDHPLDPGNKYLSHSFVESPDMMNIYNGEATLNSKGEATVEMPAWFQALNQDFRYQLTAVGAPGPNLYIAQKIVDNRFKIAGGTAGMEVSWQVTGIRHDAYANAHRIPVEQEKPVNERGYYIHPDLFGQPDGKGIEKSRTGGQNAPSGIPTGK